MITSRHLYNISNIEIQEDVSFSQLGLSDSNINDTLSFCDDNKFFQEINNNSNITGVITSTKFENEFDKGKIIILVDDPRWSFYNLYNRLTKSDYKKTPSVIDGSAEIHPTTFVSDYNVVIGKNVIIGPNSTIMADVEMKDGCKVGVNSVIGCDDVEVKRTAKGLIKVIHNGRLIIDKNVDIGNNCTIVKGLYGLDTVIGEETYISNNSHIGHNVQIGSECLILTCFVCGSANIGNNVRINPGAVISNKVKIGDNAFVTLGSVVIRDVKSNEKVTGNFAVEHSRFLYKYIKTFGPI